MVPSSTLRLIARSALAVAALTFAPADAAAQAGAHVGLDVDFGARTARARLAAIAPSVTALPPRATATFTAPAAPTEGTWSAQASAAPQLPMEYSDGYRTRAKIHKIASLAMLPLFATEGILGQSLYNNATSGKRRAHVGVAAGIGGLFGLNTVTGVWNLIEARKDANGRGRRLAHGLLMLGADAGFLTTALIAPNDTGGSRTGHRAMAVTSIGLATTGYLIMLFGGK